MKRGSNNQSSARRPQTTPQPLVNRPLTGQFHWNLNASALQSLAEWQIQELYRLFRFYDSSAIGDELPAINASRFQQLLLDAHLISEALNAQTIDNVFAQAVLGKLRTYLDKDGQPALTFQLFCGALLNCAQIRFPQDPMPMERMFTQLLSAFASQEDLDAIGSNGLLRHVSTETPAWTLEKPMEEQPETDFRQAAPFQRVIAEFSKDKVHDQLIQANLERAYTIPPELGIHFSPDLLTLIVDRFRLFDVFDRGAISRHEIYPFLSGLIRKADISDVYEVIGLLTAPDAQTGARTAEVSLHQVLRALHTYRRSKTAPNGRRSTVTTNANSASKGVDATATRSNNKDQQTKDANSGDASPNATKHHRKGKKGAKQAHHSKRTTAGTGTNSTKGTKSHTKKTGTKHRKDHHKHSSDANDIDPSVASSDPSDDTASTTATESTAASVSRAGRHGSIPRIIPQESWHSVRSSASHTPPTNPNDAVRPLTGTHREDNPHEEEEDDDVHELVSVQRPVVYDVHRMSTAMEIAVDVFKASAAAVSASVPSRKFPEDVTLFLLLGGDHDGAMYCEFHLHVSTRQLKETIGVFYQNGFREILESIPLRTHRTLEHALRLLQKRLMLRQDEGYVLLRGQDALNQVIHYLQTTQPRYTNAIQAKVNAKPQQMQQERPHSTKRMSLERAGTLVRPASQHFAMRQQLHAARATTSPGMRRTEEPNYDALLEKWDISPRKSTLWVQEINATEPSTAKRRRNPRLTPL